MDITNLYETETLLNNTVSDSGTTTIAAGADDTVFVYENTTGAVVWLISASCIPEDDTTMRNSGYANLYRQAPTNAVNIREYIPLGPTNGPGAFSVVPFPIEDGGKATVRAYNFDGSESGTYHAQYTVVGQEV